MKLLTTVLNTAITAVLHIYFICINCSSLILGKDDNYEKLFFPSLKHLHLHDNNLHSIPPHIGYQKNLESLDISNNPHLHELPKQLGNLKVDFLISFNYFFIGIYLFQHVVLYPLN